MAKRIKFYLILLLMILFSVALFEGLSLASLPTSADTVSARPRHGQLPLKRSGCELITITKALENRLKGRHLPEKAKEKLETMQKSDIRLIVALCEHMTTRDSAGAEVAFLLATALIMVD